MGDLQRDVEDLKAVINQIGEALVNQTRMSEEMAFQIRSLAQSNIELKTMLDEVKGSGSVASGSSSVNHSEVFKSRIQTL
jgi:hypothetical protein